MKLAGVAVLIGAAHLCAGADLTGDWIAQVSGFGDPEYSRVRLGVEGDKLTGSWNKGTLEGVVTGDSVDFSVRQPGGRISGSFQGRLHAAELAGNGILGERGRKVAWKMTRLARPPAGGPKTWDFEPKEFHRNYSASIAPALRVFPGDTVRTWTVDSGGYDSKLEHRTPGANPQTGPFYIEGALPGDTLVVKLNKVRLNRDSAWSGNRIGGRAMTPEAVAGAKYSSWSASEWKFDLEKGIATLAHPAEQDLPRMTNYRVPILPMIGCIGTAPAANQAFRSVDLGSFGGNIDYNQLGEGVTVYLPVFNPGALLFLGDGHAAMGDGELTGTALEVSLDVEFTVDLVKEYSTGNPRLENRDYLMSVGIAGAVPDAIQIATSQLSGWLKREYKLNDNEVAVLFGTAIKYDLAELVHPQVSVVAKVPKSALVSFNP